MIDGIGGGAVGAVDADGGNLHGGTGFGAVGSLKNHLGQLFPDIGGAVDGVAVDFAPPDEPAFFAAAPGADDDGEPVVLDVDAHCEQQAARGMVFSA